MNLSELREQVEQLNLPTEDFVLFGSAPMLVHGLIAEVNDIDIVARASAWEKAQSLGSKKLAAAGDFVISYKDTDIYDGWMGESVDAIFKRAQLLQGLKYAHLKDVLKYKLELNRAKDEEHISLLRVFLHET